MAEISASETVKKAVQDLLGEKQRHQELIQQIDTGFAELKDLLEKGGNPAAPSFYDSVLDVLQKNNGKELTVAEIAVALRQSGVTGQSDSDLVQLIYNELAQGVQSGQIKRIGHRPNNRFTLR